MRVARVRVGALRALFEPTLDALPNLAIIALLAVGGWRVSTGAVSPGDLVQAMALFTLLAFPMRVVGFLLEEMPRSVVALDRIDRVLEAAPEPTPVDPHALPGGPLDVDAEALEYGYVAGVPVLQDCDVHIASGEVVALVGPTGCGKTTLCELLAGLDRPDKGVVRVGGIDLTEVTRDDAAHERRARVPGVVPVHRHDREQHHDRHGRRARQRRLRWAAGIAQVAAVRRLAPGGVRDRDR